MKLVILIKHAIKRLHPSYTVTVSGLSCRSLPVQL